MVSPGTPSVDTVLVMRGRAASTSRRALREPHVATPGEPGKPKRRATARLAVSTYLMAGAAFVPALLLAGCVGVIPGAYAPTDPGRGPMRLSGTVAARPRGLSEVTRSLTGATEAQPVIVDLPPLANWPRYLRSEGPIYGLVQFSPYVGQYGVPADAGRADAGMGYGAVLGYRVPFSGTNALGFEIMYETSSHYNEASGVDAGATRIVAGLRANFKMDERTVPFAVAGVGMYSLEFDGLDPKFNLSGLGIMLGGGLNVSPSPRFSFRAEVARHLGDAAEESGNGGLAETLAVAFGTAFSF